MQPATEAAGGTTIAEQAERAQGWVEGTLDYCAKLLAEYGFRVLGAIIVLVVAYVVAGWTRRVVLAALSGAHLDVTIARFAANASRYAVLILALLSCAPILGINITAFAAILGAGGLAIGLASQGALSNGAAGLMLLITRPFRAGDTIVVDGTSGIVEEIELFSTTLNTLDNRRIFMPNNSIFGKVIENSSLNAHRSTTFVATVAQDSDVERVRTTLRGACASCRAVLREPAPEVLLTDLLDGGLEWSITVWAETRRWKQARDEAIAAVRDALVREKISRPAPVTTVRLLPLPQGRPDDLTARTAPSRAEN